MGPQEPEELYYNDEQYFKERDMSLIAKNSDGQDFDPTPQGLHIGICYAVYDLGTQHNEFYNIDERKVLFIWELPNERIEIKDKEAQRSKNLPRAISKKYTLSLGEKAHLRHHLETWRGQQFTPTELEGFDLQNILGAPCQLQVIHKKSKDGTKIYANIGGIVQAPKGYEPKVENPLVFFSFEDSEEIPKNTPEWIEKIIHESKEWGAKTDKEFVNQEEELPPAAHRPDEPLIDDSDDLPF